LSSKEEELVFECLKQFTEFRINENDELEMVIEKTEIERARRYSDWSRMFAVGFLLSRGFLRKIDSRSVEFAPNLYPMIADRMGDKLQALKAQARSIARDTDKQVIHELR
jgi:formate dehydrogenase assembly factor FdhD